MSATSNLSITLAQAIAYLTQPLTITHSAATINRLQSALEANLTALFTPTWTPFDFHVDPGCISVQFGRAALGNDRTEDEELFALIADEVSAPTWMTPVIDHFSASARFELPLSTISSDSCSSYCSSDLCSCFSLTAASALSSKKRKKRSSQLTRRGNPRQACAFVDISKTEVISYDCGKTTVLTGGVMLGVAPRKGKSDTST
ncbi:hypothetical protein CY34DRAFT_14312 [Suillus luteus UH-Slu-Lm8-n1]|uniref:Anti-proliferative protein domain-containing protein n=1 Tax=Suillus luteus UH-Slu-Lm8-n1 TaxID=930992 RepID=A0A0D0B6T9_9AGAM|nr:hypothetical protein CY34DRAFT_14312 [Suillus luteus UH-Slu-Lm8-n1]